MSDGVHLSLCGHHRILSDEQRAVAHVLGADATVVVVTAKAGTGKTTTASALVCAAGGQAKAVLALSFTKNGMKELVRGLFDDHGSALAKVSNSHFEAASLSVRTFDSLLHSLFRDLGVGEGAYGHAGLDWQVRSLMEIGGDPLREAGIGGGLWTHFNYERALREICDLVARGQALSPEADGVVMAYWPELDELAFEHRLVLPDRQGRLVTSNASVMAERIAANYDVVVVDEVQDCSGRDISPLISVGKLTQIVALGDPGQAVMRFRGAVGDVAGVFEAAGLEVLRLNLTVNRRSSAELVMAQNSLQLAGGWNGPLAVADSVRGHGPTPLVVVFGDENALIDAHMVFLAGCGLGPFDPMALRRLSEEVVLSIDERSSAVRDACRERTPLVEVLVPTRKAGRDLEAAFNERHVNACFVESVANPYDSSLATLLHAWFDHHRDPVAQAHVVLVRHAISWLSGLDLAEREEVRACSQVFLDGMMLGTDRPDRAAIVDQLRELCNAAIRHEAVGLPGRNYVEAVVRMLESWGHVRTLTSTSTALQELESAMHVSNRTRVRGGSRRPDVATAVSPGLIETLRTSRVVPQNVAAWLDDQGATWRAHRSEDQTAGVIIKTPHMAKGDTVDGVAAHHGEQIPFSSRPSRLAKNDYDGVEDSSVAYVGISRPRHGYVAFCYNKLPRFHEVPLDGWSYVDARRGHPCSAP